MDDVERYRKALEKIARWDASTAGGFLDEWQEAEAFSAVKRFASEALDPESKVRRIAAQDAKLKAMLAKIREFKQLPRCFYMTDKGTGSGYWVKVIKGDPNRAHDGVVRVKVLEVVNNVKVPWPERFRVGEELGLNVGNLSKTAPDPMSVTDPSGYCLVSCVTHIGVATVDGRFSWATERDAWNAREAMRADGLDPTDYTAMSIAVAKKTGRIP